MKTHLALLSLLVSIPLFAEDIETLYRNTGQLMGNLYSENGFDINAEQKRLKESLAVYDAFKERKVVVPAAFYQLIDGLSTLSSGKYNDITRYHNKVDGMLPLKMGANRKQEGSRSDLFLALCYLPNFIDQLKTHNPEEPKVSYVLKKQDLAFFLLWQLRVLNKQPFTEETKAILEAVIDTGTLSNGYVLRLWTMRYLCSIENLKSEAWATALLKKVALWKNDIKPVDVDTLAMFYSDYPELKAGLSPVIGAITAKPFSEITKQDARLLGKETMSGEDASHYIRFLVKVLVDFPSDEKTPIPQRLFSIAFKESNNFVKTLDNDTIDYALKRFDNMSLDTQVQILHILLYAKDETKGMEALSQISIKLLPKMTHRDYLPHKDRKHSRNSIGLGIVGLSLPLENPTANQVLNAYINEPFPEGKQNDVDRVTLDYNLRVAAHLLHLLGGSLDKIGHGSRYLPVLSSLCGSRDSILSYGLVKALAGPPSGIALNESLNRRAQYVFAYPSSSFAKNNLEKQLTSYGRPNSSAYEQLWVLQEEAKPLYSQKLQEEARRLLLKPKGNYIAPFILMDLEANMSGTFPDSYVKRLIAQNTEDWGLELDLLLKHGLGGSHLKELAIRYSKDKDNPRSELSSWVLDMHLDKQAKLPFPKNAFAAALKEKRQIFPILFSMARLNERLLPYSDQISSPFNLAGAYKLDMTQRGNLRNYFNLLDRMLLLKRRQKLVPYIYQRQRH